MKYLLNLFKKKPTKIKPFCPHKSVIPSGLRNTIVPKKFNDNTVWDSHLYSNITIID